MMLRYFLPVTLLLFPTAQEQRSDSYRYLNCGCVQWSATKLTLKYVYHMSICLHSPLKIFLDRKDQTKITHAFSACIRNLVCYEHTIHPYQDWFKQMNTLLLRFTYQVSNDRFVFQENIITENNYNRNNKSYRNPTANPQNVSHVFINSIGSQFHQHLIDAS